MDLEDFIVSNNFLPLGSLGYLLFCTRENGWGWEKFLDDPKTDSNSVTPRTNSCLDILSGDPFFSVFVSTLRETFPEADRRHAVKR